MAQRMVGLAVAVGAAGAVLLGAVPAQAATPTHGTVPLAAAAATPTALSRPGPARLAPTSQRVVRPNVDPATVIAIVKGAYDVYKSFTSGGTSSAAATSQILAAINSAKTEILAHIDAIATAQAKACAEEVVIDFPDFGAFNPDVKQTFALNWTSCLTLINSLQTAVTDKGAQDQLAFALDSIGPEVLMARSLVGFGNSAVGTVLVSGNNTAMAQLAPFCAQVTQEGRPAWTCSSYNGDGAVEPSLSLAQREAGARTAWAMARSVLPSLTGI